MDDGHIPTHQAHLKAEEWGIVSVVREDESQGVAVRDSCELEAKDHMAILVDSPIEGKSFTVMGVQTNFISAAATAAKGDGMEC